MKFKVQNSKFKTIFMKGFFELLSVSLFMTHVSRFTISLNDFNDPNDVTT